jgi:hypothetical protein
LIKETSGGETVVSLLALSDAQRLDSVLHLRQIFVLISLHEPQGSTFALASKARQPIIAMHYGGR